MGDTPATIEGTALLGDASGLQWFEAVAVILQLADTMKQTAVSSAPDLPHVRLAADGTVAIYAGPELSHQAVRPLAATLKLLLQRTGAPPELMQLVSREAEMEPADHDINRFVEALHYFERPDRGAILRRVVDRIGTAEAQARVALELERLRVKARDAAMVPPEVKKEQAPPVRRRGRVVAIVAMAVLLVVLGAAAFAWWKFRPEVVRAGNEVGSIVSQAGQKVATVFNRGIEKLVGARPQEAAPQAEAEATAPAKRTPVAKAKRATAKGTTKEGAGEGVVAETPGAVEPAPTPAPILPGLLQPSTVLTFPDSPSLITPPRSAAANESGADPERVYSRLDPDVTPPVPLQPLLGQVTSDSMGIAGDMEVLISAAGIVERVNLLLPNRFQDRMLVFAMKARQFKPATLNGRPVRYLLRVRTGR